MKTFKVSVPQLGEIHIDAEDREHVVEELRRWFKVDEAELDIEEMNN